MTAPLSTEIEFKFAVDGAESFNNLVVQLGMPRSVLSNSVTQVNHFFDSHSLCLHNADLAVRLRVQDRKNIFTIKGKSSYHAEDRQALSQRIEVETEIPDHAAHDLLEGHIAPVDIIKQYLPLHADSLLEMIDHACVDEPLKYIGKFSNERIILPEYRLESGEISTNIVFELDSSTFLDGSVEHEVEVEISDITHADEIHHALTNILEKAGINWTTAPSKAARFFARL
jgi:uncharacterized protein YjbK